jgi:hypothetical protein
MSENDFECFASTGVNTPETMFSNSWFCEYGSPEADFWPVRLSVFHFRRVNAVHRIVIGDRLEVGQRCADG